jgi:hypothetical protein
MVLRRGGALLWTYALNLGIALLFSLRGYTQLANLLDHSLAAERLNAAFDLGTVLAALSRINRDVPSTGSTGYLGMPVYLLVYFILVPGTLFCYQNASPARLSILFSTGLTFFWRFVRITLLTLLISALVLGPLGAAMNAWFGWVDEHVTGWAVYWDELAVLLPWLLVAALLRVYFDLVEVYTVQLNERVRADGQPDRRVRLVLGHAWRVMWTNFGRVYGSFVALTLLGFAAFLLLARIAVHMFAQPRVLPMFLLAQAGLLAMMATRFWQRGAETVLAQDRPLPAPEMTEEERAFAGQSTVWRPAAVRIEERHHRGPVAVADPQPDPEPIAPSLSEPDPEVFHHDPGTAE